MYKAHQPPGTPPGTLTPTPGARPTRIEAVAFDPGRCAEHTVDNAEGAHALLDQFPMVWVRVTGLGTVDAIAGFGPTFGLHPLALEDVMNTHQRPKAELYDGTLFIVLTAAKAEGDTIDTEQVGIFVGKNFVASFQEGNCAVLIPVLERLRAGQGKRERFMHPDYLAYTIIDTIIDGYFPVLEQVGDRLDVLEDQVVVRPQPVFIAATHQIKRDLQRLRHNLWPMRDMIGSVTAADEFVRPETQPYLRDCHDHIVQIIDMLETHRERASGLIDIYLSSLANRTNEIMRVLTIIATIFMPLSFIASLYGMNFDTSSPWNLPELHWRYGYPYALGLMLTVTVVMLTWFKRRGWFRSSLPDEDA